MKYKISWENKEWNIWWNNKYRNWYLRLILDLIIIYCKRKIKHKYSDTTEYYTWIYLKF